MATIKPVWTEAVVIRADASLATSTTAAYDLDLDNLGADRYEVQIDIDIGSSTGCRVDIFGSPDSGTTDDTTALMSYTVAADDIRTLVLEGAFRVVSVTNEDGSNAVTGVEINGAWRQWNST